MMNMHWNSTMSTQNLGSQTFAPHFYHKSNVIDYVSNGQKERVINLYESDKKWNTNFFFGKLEIL